jgi:hypothetical protein
MEIGAERVQVFFLKAEKSLTKCTQYSLIFGAQTLLGEKTKATTPVFKTITVFLVRSFLWKMTEYPETGRVAQV